MAWNPVTLFGSAKDANNSTTTVTGTIWFQLSQTGNCTSGGFQIASGDSVTFPLASGVIQVNPITGNLSITANDDIVPSGTYYIESVMSADGALVARRNVQILGPGTSKDIGTLPVPSLPFSAGGVPVSRQILTTSPLSGGGDLSVDRTLSVSVSPGGAGTVVGTSRTLTTTAPLSGGGDLSADRSLSVAITPGGATIAVGSTRSIATTAPVTGGGDLSADRTIAVSQFTTGVAGVVPASGSATGTKVIFDDGIWRVPSAAGSAYQTVQVAAVAQTQRPIVNYIGSAFSVADNGGATRTDLTLNQSPAGATSVVGTTRTITTTSPLTIAGAGSADLSADRTIALTNPLPVANGGTGSTSQNFVDLTTTQASVAGQKTLLGNNVTNNTQLGTVFQNGNGVGYFEGVAGVGDPAGTLGPDGARCVLIIDGSAANPITDPGIGTSDFARPTTLTQRTTSATATSEISNVFTTLIKGGSGERYGMFNAVHVAAGASGSGDVVGFTASTYMEAATTASHTAYAMWPRIERTVVTRTCGIEIDCFNSSGTDAANTDASTTNSTIGIAVNCGGNAKNSVGIAFQSAGASTAWFYGIQFDIGTCTNAGINFQSSSVAAGGYGIDFNALGVSPIRFANAQPVLGRNAANTLDKQMLQINANDQVNLDPSGTQGTLISGQFCLTRIGLALIAGAGLNSNLTNPAGAFVRLVGATGAFSIGGFVAPTGAVSQILMVFNAFAQTMTIVNEDLSSTAANRITTLTGANVVLRAAATSMFTIVYDSGTARWILQSTN